MTGLPGFLVIGAQKAGTSWLHQNLRRHPGIFMPRAKDQGFFCWVDGPQAISLEEYRRSFDDCRNDQLPGEATAAYFWTATGSPWDVKPAGYCPDIPGRVKDALGRDIRLVLSLRDPVERAVSAYLHHIAFGDLDPAVSLLDAGDFIGLLDIGFYAAHLRNWQRCFPREHFLILGFEQDIVAQPRNTLTRVFEFLGVDADHHVDEATQPVFEGTERIWVEDEVWVPAGDGVVQSSDGFRQFTGKDYRRLVDRATIQTLREIYAADQAELFELID